MSHGRFCRYLRSSRLPCIDGRWLLVRLSILTLSLPVAQASPIEFHYGGVISSADAGTGVAPGAQFDGTFMYDPQTNPQTMYIENAHSYTFGQPTLDGMSTTTPPDTSAMSLTVGGALKFSQQGGLTMEVNEVESNDPYNPNPVTNFSVNSYNPTTKLNLDLLLSNPKQGVFGSLNIPTALNLANFPTATVTVSWWDPTRQAIDSYQGTIDTLTQLGTSLTTVPETATVGLWLGLGAAGWVLRTRMRRGDQA